MFSDKSTLAIICADKVSHIETPDDALNAMNNQWRFLATQELYCIEASRNSSFTFCNVVIINIYPQEKAYEMKDDRKANPHAETQQWFIQLGSKCFFVQVVYSKSSSHVP